MQQHIWSCFVVTASAPYSFASYSDSSHSKSPSPKSILIQAILDKLYTTWVNPLWQTTLPPPVILPSTAGISFTIYTWKRDGGTKWRNREQTNNLICFNILQTMHEAYQEQWMCDRCSFLFSLPGVLQDFAPLYIGIPHARTVCRKE